MIVLASLLPVMAALQTDSVPSVARVRVSEPGAVRMAPLLDSLEGRPLRRDTVRAWMLRAVDSVAAKGFLAASATATDTTTTDSGLVLDLRASAGQRFVWGSVRDAGTTRLTPYALGRLSGLKTGEPADPARMQDARKRILSSGYVEEESSPRPVRVPRTALVDMRTALRDKASSSIEAVGAWSQGGASSGYVTIVLADILGTARDLDFGISEASGAIDAHIGWKEPWIGPLDLQAKLYAALAQDTLSRVLQAHADLSWSSNDGSTTLLVGLTTASRAERTTTDSVFGPETDEWGTRAGVAWTSSPASAWPVSQISTDILVEAVQVVSDTGGSQRVRAKASLEAFHPLGPLVGRLGVHARGILPLDNSVGLTEALSPGGIGGWRGWPEGSPRTPAWFWNTTEVRVGSSRFGGVAAFFEPGVRAVRRSDLSWSPRASWSAGGGAELIFPGWLVELVLSARDDTKDWTESLLQVRAANRF